MAGGAPTDASSYLIRSERTLSKDLQSGFWHSLGTRRPQTARAARAREKSPLAHKRGLKADRAGARSLSGHCGWAPRYRSEGLGLARRSTDVTPSPEDRPRLSHRWAGSMPGTEWNRPTPKLRRCATALHSRRVSRARRSRGNGDVDAWRDRLATADPLQTLELVQRAIEEPVEVCLVAQKGLWR